MKKSLLIFCIFISFITNSYASSNIKDIDIENNYSNIKLYLPKSVDILLHTIRLEKKWEQDLNINQKLLNDIWNILWQNKLQWKSSGLFKFVL
jgi:aspartate/tyrosine/aromatic aminotransferase